MGRGSAIRFHTMKSWLGIDELFDPPVFRGEFEAKVLR